MYIVRSMRTSYAAYGNSAVLLERNGRNEFNTDL